MQFSKQKFELASAKVFQAAFGLDKAIAKTANVKQAWAEQACAGIAAGKLTIDDVERQLIADYRGQALSGDEQADFDVETAKIGDCGSTIKGWFYDLKRVVASEQSHRVMQGESLTTVRRDTKPRQAQTKGKAAPAPKAVAKRPSLNECIAGVRYYVQSAMANASEANALAANSALSDMFADIVKLDEMVSKNLELDVAA